MPPIPHERVDDKDPRSILEAQEAEDALDHQQLAFAIGRILAWLVDGRTLSGIGFRTMIVCAKIRPDLVEGASYDDIAKRCGHGRSSAHKLASEFSESFGVRGINDRQEQTRAKLRQAWRKSHRARPAAISNEQHRTEPITGARALAASKPVQG